MMKIFKRRDGTVTDPEHVDYRWRDGVYLTTVNDSLEADILVSKLDAEGIPAEKKYIGSSNFLEIAFGTNIVGSIEIYVPEERLEDARNIIVPVDLDDCIQEGIPGAEPQEMAEGQDGNAGAENSEAGRAGNVQDREKEHENRQI